MRTVLGKLVTVVAVILTLLVVALPTAAAPTGPQTLTGEGTLCRGNPYTLDCYTSDNGLSLTNQTYTCDANYDTSPDIGGTFGVTYRGGVTGPYPGEITATITATVSPAGLVTAFHETFTITSLTTGAVIARGTKDLGGTTGSGQCRPPFVPDGNFSGGTCCRPPHGFQASLDNVHATYQATIYTASGNYQDRGTAVVKAFSGLNGHYGYFEQDFTSKGLAPTTKEQCKDGGFQFLTDPRTGQPFKNQGACVSFVANGK